MSGPFGSSQWMYSSGGFYPTEIDQSLRLNDDDSAYLSRTPASAGNRKTWTWSGWVKRSSFAQNFLFSTGADGNNRLQISFENYTNDNLALEAKSGGSTQALIVTNATYRDTSAWYHIVIAVDTTQATSSDRIKFYVNGLQVTDLQYSTYPSLNADLEINKAQAHNIAKRTYTSTYFDGYLSEVNFIDGQALDPTDFGEFKSGVWVAKSYAGSYGTNGFYLNFSDSANIGDDLSGNANDWTANNLVATDVVLDSPTQNWCVLNNLNEGKNCSPTPMTFQEGNLECAYNRSTSGGTYAVGTMGIPNSGKWYAEMLISAGDYPSFGVASVFQRDTIASAQNSRAYGSFNGNKLSWDASGSVTVNTGYGASFGVGDVVGIAVDMDAGELEFYKNGVSQGVAFTDLISSGVEWTFLVQGTGGNTATSNANFGQDSSFAGNKTAQGNTDDNGVGDFYYAPPSGYLALCTANLPDPVIDPAQDESPSDYFGTSLWTGNSSTQSITGLGFQPDWVWIKSRSNASQHVLTDAVRGATQTLSSNATSAEVTSAGDLTSFDADGFSVGSNSRVNGSGDNIVGWSWLAGNGTSSNTDGSITSTVSVNQKAGFSVVSYTGTGSVETIGHGLGAVPAVIIVKDRNSAEQWNVYHHKNTSAPETDYLVLNNADATTDGAGKWNDTAPTSSVFTVGTANTTNTSGDSFIAYCFAEIPSYSSFGVYSGNNSTDGPFIFCGFLPAFVLIKRTNQAGANWQIFDNKRNVYNLADGTLAPNVSDAEVTSTTASLDFVSNGFKVRGDGGTVNDLDDTYIYMAFAENPFKYANAR